MIYSLDCLRHDIVVSGDDDDTEVCDLGTTCTHGGESLVTGSVKECDMTSVGKLHIVSTDMLCYTTGLTGNNVGIADIVKQRCLTMVNVAHDCNNRGT